MRMRRRATDACRRIADGVRCRRARQDRGDAASSAGDAEQEDRVQLAARAVRAL